MSKDLQIMPIGEVQTMATNLANSGLFPGIKNEQQAFTLMMLCQSEGLHPMKALQRYDIIEGRPGLKAAAMQADFQKLGGKISILKRDSECCQMHFDYQGMDTTITVTLEEFTRVGITKGKYGVKANWAKHPRQMLHARCVSEGINAVCPQVKTGMVTPEELMDMTPEVENKVESILYTQEPEKVNGNDVEKAVLPDEEVQIAKDSKKLRAAINKEMLALTSEDEIRKVCAKYNGVHGKDFWDSFTYKNNEKFETFKDVAQRHIDRVLASDERHTPEAHEEWVNGVLEGGNVKFQSYLSAYNTDEKYQADQQCYDVLKERAIDLGLWNDEEQTFIKVK